MRAGLLFALLPSVALAHVVTFDFVEPSGVGARTDGGMIAIQWVDGPDPSGLADLMFFASRNGLAPFAAAPRDTQLNASPVAVADPANVLPWDTTAVPPGCYQPFAVLHDQIEGETTRPAAGVITVAPPDGGNIPPALWILNLVSDKPADGGQFALRIKVVDPDDVGELTVRWSDGADAGGTIVAGLPTNDGGGTLTYAFNARSLPPAAVYYLRAEAKGFDGQRCETWWSGNLPGNRAPDAGPVDAGAIDAGTADGGIEPPLTPRGCGCSAGSGPIAWVGALWLARRRGGRPTTGRGVNGGRAWVLAMVLTTASGCILRSAVQAVDLPAGGLEVRDVAYWHGEGWDDEKHRLDLYVPPGPGPHPVLVFVHGGGWRFGDRQQILSSYVKLGRRLAANGVMGVVISYRLSPRFKHPAQIRDVARAIGWTLSRAADFGGDPNRVYVMGHSAGAQLVALAATDPRWLAEVSASPSQLKGVIGVSGPYDVEHLGRSTLFGGLSMVIPTFGSSPAVWRDAMPANHLAASAPPPFLIAWADGDPELLRRDARVFVEELEQHHQKVETFQTTFDDHFSIITDFAAPGNALGERVLRFMQR